VRLLDRASRVMDGAKIGVISRFRIAETRQRAIETVRASFET